MDVNEKLATLSSTYPILTKIFTAEWGTPLGEFSPKLFQVEPKNIEPELIAAFRDEWLDMGIQPGLAKNLENQLLKIPVIQTSHHITPTNGPTFLAIDLISLSGLPSGMVYLVGANSGVAFSNSAWSGAISYGSLSLDQLLTSGTKTYTTARKAAKERKAHGDEDARVSIIPSKTRDQLLYVTPQSDDLTRFRADAIASFKKLIPEADPAKPYSHWATEMCRRVQTNLLETDRIIYFDINRVINRYLVSVLKTRPDHPCARLLTDSSGEMHAIFNSFDNPPVFLQSYKGKKSFKVDQVYRTRNGYKSDRSGEIPMDSDRLVQLLENHQFCPGIFLLFLVLRFLNGIHCLGSFNQIEYLEKQRQTWQKAATDWHLYLDPEQTCSLTTGRMINENGAMWPIDMLLTSQTVSVKRFLERDMGSFWEPILDQLVKRVT